MDPRPNAENRLEPGKVIEAIGLHRQREERGPRVSTDKSCHLVDDVLEPPTGSAPAIANDHQIPVPSRSASRPADPPLAETITQ